MDRVEPSLPEPSAFDHLTTVHLRRAREGDRESLAWLVERFTPLLIAQARRRLGPALLRGHDPEDVVQDVWVTVLDRVSGLAELDGRATPALMRFLATTLLYKVNALLRRSAVRGDPKDGLSDLAAATRGPLQRALGGEFTLAFEAALAELSERDQELIVLRLIEQQPNAAVAEILGLERDTASRAYGRALQRLRKRLASPLLDELGEQGTTAP
jgi:RNA polymerase sigma factor (sigma-70 family)